MKNTGIMLTLLLASYSIQAAQIFSETFETDGLGTRYTAAGAGNGGGGCCEVWQRNSTDGGDHSDVLVGFEGSDFWAGDDLDDVDLPDGFSPSNPRNLIMNNVGLIGFAPVSLDVLLAASANMETNDFLRVFAVNNDTNIRTVLDDFQPIGRILTGSTSGMQLGLTFQNFSYLIPSGITNLSIGFEGWTNTNTEVLGIDNIRLASQSVPEPSSGILLCIGIGSALLSRRRLNKSAT